MDKASSQITDYYKQNRSPQYEEILSWYRELDSKSEYVKLVEYGNTDIGKPIEVLIIDADQEFDPIASRKRNKSILLINNGIHPGEPDGIDACIKMINELTGDEDIKQKIKNVTICVILVYNIDGCLNRNSTTRVNQNGPESFGFRGNAQNYDLNRDFVKCDSKNAMTFTDIFRTWDPDVFVDTHVSNGADYQHVMTLIATQHSKLTPPLGDYLKNKMLPELYSEMKSAGSPMCPYIYETGKIPDEGIAGFLDLPRYSTGYTALYNTIGFMPETHMLKTYEQRVESTYELLKIYLNYVNQHASEIIKARNEAVNFTKSQKEFAINWELDTTKKEEFLFSGFEAKYKPSDVSGLERLYYDRNSPFQKNIPVLDTYRVSEKIIAPSAYIIPQAWSRVIDRLKANKIEMGQLASDTVLEVEAYYIESFQTSETAYEGHYYHSQVKLRTVKQKVQFYKGDYMIRMNQAANRYLAETLEPQAPDSFFAWGFFDAILMQKEWFSDYVFEDLASEILNNDPELKKRLEEKKTSDAEFAGNAWAQLQFVFENSEYHEITHNRFPVFRME